MSPRTMNGMKKVMSNDDDDADDNVFEEVPINKIVDNSDEKINITISAANMYTQRYRIIKTVLMVLAWVSYGLNFELTGTTLEDLKVLLDVNYQSIAFILVIRSLGYIVVTFCVGLVLDKLLKYSELLMAVAKLLIIIPNFLIPWLKVYWVSFALFLLQGCAQGLYDVGGNQIILRLWNGISSAPISAMQSGYGIGAMITVQLLKPFIKFDPGHEQMKDTVNDTIQNRSNSSNTLTPDDITLQVPFGISAAFGAIILVCFVIAQYFETKNRQKHKKFQQKSQTISLKNTSKASSTPIKEINIQEDNENIRFILAQKLLFSGKYQETSAFAYKVVLVILMIVLCMAVSGYQTVLAAFLFTYLTKGPAKFLLRNMLTIQTLFWAFFVTGRLITAVVAFKMSAILFFGILVLVNISLLTIYVIPALNTMQIFYWFMICLLGVSVSPMIPTCFMLAKTLLINVNSFLISLFCIGLGIGAISSVYLTGMLLDSFKPTNTWLGYSDATSVYIIPIFIYSWLGLCLIVYLLILFVYKRYRYVTIERLSNSIE